MKSKNAKKIFRERERHQELYRLSQEDLILSPRIDIKNV